MWSFPSAIRVRLPAEKLLYKSSRAPSLRAGPPTVRASMSCDQVHGGVTRRLASVRHVHWMCVKQSPQLIRTRTFSGFLHLASDMCEFSPPSLTRLAHWTTLPNLLAVLRRVRVESGEFAPLQKSSKFTNNLIKSSSDAKHFTNSMASNVAQSQIWLEKRRNFQTMWPEI